MHFKQYFGSSPVLTVWTNLFLTRQCNLIFFQIFLIRTKQNSSKISSKKMTHHWDTSNKKLQPNRRIKDCPKKVFEFERNVFVSSQPNIWLNFRPKLWPNSDLVLFPPSEEKSSFEWQTKRGETMWTVNFYAVQWIKTYCQNRKSPS